MIFPTSTSAVFLATFMLAAPLGRHGVHGDPICPGDLVYNCGSHCPRTCDNPTPGPCIFVCVDGCFCPLGKIRVEGTNLCVDSTSECPSNPCPAQIPTPGTPCTPPDSGTCFYGTEECCGEIHSSDSCRCVDGLWQRIPTHACQNPFCCPSNEPTPGDTCTPPPFGVGTCYYGTEECCGEVHDSRFCTCDSGVAPPEWQCVVTDACLGVEINGCPGECRSGSACGDPHFLTWAGQWYGKHR